LVEEADDETDELELLEADELLLDEADELGLDDTDDDEEEDLLLVELEADVICPARSDAEEDTYIVRVQLACFYMRDGTPQDRSDT
jgi:hypothetical protein